MFSARCFHLCHRAAYQAAWSGLVVTGMMLASTASAQVPPSTSAATPIASVGDEEAYPRAAKTWVEAQVELARRGFSGGAIDGIRGPQSTAALQAFQQREGIAPSGV